jgi:hypothetical protein
MPNGGQQWRGAGHQRQLMTRPIIRIVCHGPARKQREVPEYPWYEFAHSDGNTITFYTHDPPTDTPRISREHLAEVVEWAKCERNAEVDAF